MKNKYYSNVAKKLLDPSTTLEVYWSIMKTFLDNKKISIIPPIVHEHKFIINYFKQKAEIFNFHISK